MLEINKCYYLADEGIKIRVIAIDIVNKVSYYVELSARGAVPRKISNDVASYLILAGEMTQVEDPHGGFIDPDILTESRINKANQNYMIVQSYWSNEDKKIDLMDHSCRNKLYKEIASEKSINEYTVRNLFTRFWQRGMTRNSMLPDYDNSGAPGKPRVQTQKVGVKTTIEVFGQISDGHLLTDDDKKNFMLAVTKFYRNRLKKSYRRAYEDMLKAYYSPYVIFDSDTGEGSYDPEKVPSYDQFYNWVRSTRNCYLDKIKRDGKRKYNLTERPLFSTAVKNISGPGVQYELDAMEANINLVSTLDLTQTIGKPTVYLATDTFSTLIGGFYASIEPENWTGYAMLLRNVIEDKVEFVEGIGVEPITENMWPSHHMAKNLLSDNGSFVSQMADSLANYYQISLKNAGSYRGDMKGSVEKCFSVLKKELAAMPGGIPIEADKKEIEEAKKKAKLRLEDFVQVLICLIITYNNNVLEGKHVTADMVRDNVKATPSVIWQWGVEKYGLPPQYYNEHAFGIFLLPENSECNVSRDGISLNGANYTCEKFINEHWEVNRLTQSVKMKYNPNRLNEAYLLEKGQPIVSCHLTDKWEEYGDLTVAEFRIIQSEIRKEKKADRYKNIYNTNHGRSQISKIIKNVPSIPNSNKKIKGIKAARKEEIEYQNKGKSVEVVIPENNVIDINRNEKRELIAKMDDIFN